ncbi:MAG: TetR/AcrR family transcriptional regulator [Clostridiales bacterium]|nr:TetR/AcrR family transcriptional regulator [Clostridiales bacterium]
MAGKRDDRRVEFTKMMLRESLAGLMRGKPIQRITVKEICETAELNRGTFYAHFSDQYDLLRHTEDVEMETVSTYVLRIASGGEEEREQVCAELFRHIREHSGVWGSLLSENGNAEFSKRMFDKLFTDLAQAGVCSPDDACAKLSFTFMMVGYVGMASRWLSEEPGVTPEQMGKLLCNILSGKILNGG